MSFNSLLNRKFNLYRPIDSWSTDGTVYRSYMLISANEKGRLHVASASEKEEFSRTDVRLTHILYTKHNFVIDNDDQVIMQDREDEVLIVIFAIEPSKQNHHKKVMLTSKQPEDFEL